VVRAYYYTAIIEDQELFAPAQAKERPGVSGSVGPNFEVGGPRATDNAAIVNHAVLSGVGIGIAQMWQVRELIQSQRLRVILQDYRTRYLFTW